MMASETILCAIPGICWGDRESKYPPIELLRRFLRDLATIERRLSKDVARDDEVHRYARLCGQIEQIALSNAIFAPTSQTFRMRLKQGWFPSLRIGSEYVDLIRCIQLGYETGPAVKGRFGASVFSPREIKTHVQCFTNAAQLYKYQYYPAIQHRLWFITRRIIKYGCGLVEIPDPLSISLQSELQKGGGLDGRDWWECLWEQIIGLIREKPRPAFSAAERRAQTQANVVTLSTATDWQQYGHDNRGDFMQDRLRNQIRAAITHGIPVNLMNQRQNMVTVIFQEFIHKEKGQSPAEAPVMYNDGRTARPFPLYCLPRMPDGWTPTKEYHFALMSMRHLPIDQYIDMNWFRNVEIQTGAGLAASDESCYQVSMGQLKELLDTNRGHCIRIHLYHTGYMPAVVGLYRAVMSTLKSDKYEPGCLQVLPKLQPGKDGFVEGKPWPE